MNLPTFINPITVLTGLVIITLIFNGFSYTNDNIQRGQLKDILQRQGNLTEERRNAIIIALEESAKILPEINEALQNITTAQPQSNFTAQKQAIANIEYLMDSVDEIKLMLNSSVDIPSNRTIDREIE